MKRIVLTGGIATGKSSFLSRLEELSPGLGIFDCDRAVHDLLTEDEVLHKLRALFGDPVFDGEILNRAALRRVVLADESCRRRLEALLHPRVWTRCESSFAAYRAAHPEEEGIFIADVPLFYETDGSYPNDMVAVVATTRMTQENRLRCRSNYSLGEMRAMLAAQWPIEKKVRLADVVIWNESPIGRLQDQAQLFLQLVRER